MPNQIPNDKRFADLMRKSKLEMPFSDFEANVMQKIEDELSAKASILKDIQVAIIFFVLGTGLGTAASLFLPQVLSTVVGVSATGIGLIFQAIFVVIFLSQLERLISLLRKHRRI